MANNPFHAGETAGKIVLRHRPRRQCGQDFSHGIEIVENLSDTDRMHLLLLLLLWQFGNMDQGGRGGGGGATLESGRP